jgi:hypothetical protein
VPDVYILLDIGYRYPAHPYNTETCDSVGQVLNVLLKLVNGSLTSVIFKTFCNWRENYLLFKQIFLVQEKNHRRIRKEIIVYN